MANELTVKDEGRVAVLGAHDIGDILKPLVKEIHLFDTYIAGTTHLDDLSVIKKAKKDDELILKRENNKYDYNAILVLNTEKKKLGYVPMKDNIVFARLMDAGKLLKARITDIEKRDSFTEISIRIVMVDY